MGYTTVSTSTAVSSTLWNGQVRDQVVSVFASEAARNIAITSPVEGMLCYTSDTDSFWAYNGSAWVGYGRASAWGTYTPTLTQSSTVSATVTQARWNRIGRTIFTHVQLSVTATGTANNAVTVTLPFTAAYANTGAVGQGFIYDASPGNTTHSGIAYLQSTTTIRLTDTNSGVTGGLGAASTSFTAALASGDFVTFSAVYEAAS